ncbi:MAG: hypothetical protein IPP40_14615 [bacterium]|nr:hypothetical protein [bacterium]
MKSAAVKHEQKERLGMFVKRLSVSLAMLLMTGLSFGECAWEVSVTDWSGDGLSTSADFTLPCATEAIYVYYELPGNEHFYVEVEDTGIGILLAAQSMKCGCANVIVFKNVGGLPKGSILRLKAASESCEGASSLSGKAAVLFYSPATLNPSTKCEGGN